MLVIVPNEGLYLPETKTMKVTLFNQYRNETEVIAAPTKLSMLITKYRKTKKESMLITKHSCGRSEGIRRIEVKEKWWKVLTHFFQFPFKTFFGSTFICCNDSPMTVWWGNILAIWLAEKDFTEKFSPPHKALATIWKIL